MVYSFPSLPLAGPARWLVERFIVVRRIRQNRMSIQVTVDKKEIAQRRDREREEIQSERAGLSWPRGKRERLKEVGGGWEGSELYLILFTELHGCIGSQVISSESISCLRQ